MKQIIIILMLSLGLIGSLFGQDEKIEKTFKTVTFTCNMHCQSCQEKIEHNMAFEKGVKAVTTDLDEQKVRITYRTDKNSDEKLKKALKDLGYEAEIVTDEPKVEKPQE
ncbi:MAG: heavy-metal-associated domain-containing protein [Bacteroidales bacterium]|nr:heavy-metal-associated domain-containing protein [Bacteroidales bacterium]